MNSSQWGGFVCAVFLYLFAKSKHRRCGFANEALNSYNIKMQYTSQAQVKIRVNHSHRNEE